MAVILYRSGNTDTIRGIPCNTLICNEHSYLHLLDEGWFYSPEECYAEKEKIDEKADVLEEKTESDSEDDEKTRPKPVLTNDGIRAAAKKAGIRSWHNKKIERLVKELGELEDAE